MRWVWHSLGEAAMFALVVGMATTVVVGAAVRGWEHRTGSELRRGALASSVAAGATVAVALAILGVSPHGDRPFPAHGDFEGWRWRWAGDLPDVDLAGLASNYTAAIALLNFGVFLAWGAVMAWAGSSTRRGTVVIVVVALPVALELLQRYPFGGTPSVTDAWTNILGGLAGIGGWHAFVVGRQRLATRKARAPR